MNIHIRNRGFTVVEIMIALAIGIALTGFLIAIFVNNKQATASNSRIIETNNNLRFALTLMSEDLINSGFYGGINYKDTVYKGTNVEITTCTGSAYTKNYKLAGGVNITDYTASATATEYPIWGASSSTSIGCLSSVTSGSDYISVKGVAGRTDNDDSQRSVIYTRAGEDEGMLFVGDSSATDVEGSAANISKSENMNWEYRNHIYYLSNNQLKRRYLTVSGTSSAWDDEVLVGSTDNTKSGIENMQILYGVDTDADGIANYFTDAANVALANWNNVLVVKIFLLARSGTDSQYTDKKTYTLGDVSVDPDPDDNYHRRVISSTVFLRNKWYVITGSI